MCRGFDHFSIRTKFLIFFPSYTIFKIIANRDRCDEQTAGILFHEPKKSSDGTKFQHFAGLNLKYHVYAVKYYVSSSYTKIGMFRFTLHVSGRDPTVETTELWCTVVASSQSQLLGLAKCYSEYLHTQ